MLEDKFSTELACSVAPWEPSETCSESLATCLDELFISDNTEFESVY